MFLDNTACNIASINQIGSEIYLATFNSPLLRLVNQ